MNVIKKAFKAIDTYLDEDRNREKVLICSIALIAVAAIVRR